jgi:mono/diheme cytochrome c family protein
VNQFRLSNGSFIVIVLAAFAIAMLGCSLGPAGSSESADTAPSGEAAPTTDPTQPSELQAAFDALPAGDPARGEQIFNAQPCHVCHVDNAVGPTLPGDPAVATAAADRKPGYSPELYLYESIVDPSAYVVSGYPDGVMPATMSHTLSEQDIADLIAYLMTLK